MFFSAAQTSDVMEYEVEVYDEEEHHCVICDAVFTRYLGVDH